MKVLVTGASGLLGREVLCTLRTSSILSSAIGTCFSRKVGDLIPVDLTVEDEIKSLIQQHKPDVIVHCAAERRPDNVEKKTAEAEDLNVRATEILCRHANGTGAWVLYLSTDYVFDGTKAPYMIDAIPNPLNTYGELKLAGEKAALGCSLYNAVLRVPILYGPVEHFSESAVTTLWSSVKSGDQCTMDHRQRRYPTHTNAVADIIKQMTEKHAQQKWSVTGIYHFSEPVLMTKYDMAIAMARTMSLSTDHILADTSEPPADATPRPFDCQLDTSRLTDEGFTLKTKEFNSAMKDILSHFN